MTHTLNIALLQILPTDSTEGNLQKGLQACREAKQLGVDLVLFPEMWHIGYDSLLFSQQYALDLHDSFIAAYCDLAQELSLGIGITYAGKGQRMPRNCFALIDQQGTILFEYAKVNTCAFQGGYELELEAGSAFSVAEFNFGRGKVTIGSMICFDREFPQPAYELARQNAEVILVPNACLLQEDRVLGDIRFQQVRTRAFENMTALAVCNYPAPREDGNSCLIGADGKPIFVASNQEGIYLASLDLLALRTWRENEVWGPVACRKSFGV